MENPPDDRIFRRVFPLHAREAMRRGAASGATLIAFADPAEYAGACLAALAAGRAAWCLNPKWGAAELAEARALIAADDPARPGLRIATGGTGGRVKFVRHTAATLSAAVSGFSGYATARLGAGPSPALSAAQALPCHHVSGLMPVVRAFLTDGDLVFADGSMRGELPAPPSRPGAFLTVSLVAAQLHRALDRADGVAWLRGFDLVLAGGSAVSPTLLARAREARIPLGVSYGMTETAALAALWPPEALFAGESSPAGEPLPHIGVRITSEGRVALRGASLGEDVSRDAEGWHVTGDEGFLDARGRLVVTGRADRIVICGGEKVDPQATEAAILATGLVREALVVAVPDAEWGAVLHAHVTPRIPGVSVAAELRAALAARLAPHRVPRRIHEADTLPLDERGKFSRNKPA